MDIELIKAKESANDGQTINLYFDEMVGFYVAYGLSAYYATMIVSPFLSFSETMEMPLALLSRNDIKYLRQSVTTLEHQINSYYRLRLRTKIGDAGYERWQKETFGDK